MTHNVDDFPKKALDPFYVEAQRPDAFLEGLIELSPTAVLRVVGEQAGDLRSRPSPAELLARLERIGLPRFVQTLSRLSRDR